MDLGLEGKRFVVGGGSRGLGRAIAQELVREGAHVVVVSREPQAAADELGERATAFAGDLAEPADVERLAASLGDGALDGLLVNHGGPPGGEVLGLSDEQWRGAYELVLGGPIRLVRALAPRLRDPSAILFVTSSSVRQPIPNLDTSNVLRPAVAALVKCLSRELAPRTRVNSIAPGRLDTERVRSLDEARATAAGTTPDELRERTAATIPLGRYGDPAELARVAAFMLSPAASYVTGAAIQVDGGMVSATP